MDVETLVSANEIEVSMHCAHRVPTIEYGYDDVCILFGSLSSEVYAMDADGIVWASCAMERR